MGKKRLGQVHEETGYTEKKKVREIAKQAMIDMGDKQDDYAMLTTRRRYYKKRWAKELGTDPNPNNIADMAIIEKIRANPQVHIEWMLCDPRLQRQIRKPQGRDLFLSTLSEDELEIYLHGPDGKGGYSDLELPMGKQIRRSAGRLVKSIVKKGQDEAIDDFIAGDEKDDGDDEEEEDDSEEEEGVVTVKTP